MIEVKLTFATITEALEFLSRDKTSSAAALVTTDAPAEAPKRGRKPKIEAPAEPSAPVAAMIVETATQAASAEALFGGAQQAPAPVEQPKATQKDLLVVFRALAETKGTGPVVEIIRKYDVKSVALIPEAKWGEAIGLAQAAFGGTQEAWAAALEKVKAGTK